MEPIHIPITMSPHFVHGKPRGYYLLAQRIFPRGAPILVKQQFVGFSSSLIVTACHPAHCDTVLKMAVEYPILGEKGVTWLNTAALYPMPMGFRMYIPGTILLPKTTERKIFSGIVAQEREVFYVEVPKLNGDILLDRKDM